MPVHVTAETGNEEFVDADLPALEEDSNAEDDTATVDSDAWRVRPNMDRGLDEQDVQQEPAPDGNAGPAGIQDVQQGPGHGRWPGRVRNAPERFAFNVHGVPSRHDFDNPAVSQALHREDRDLWIEAINSELRSIFEKDVYDECALPPGKRALTTKLVLHIKRDQWDNIIKYKARLVARGFMQEEGVDFSDIFAPTAQSASFRVLTSIAAQRGLPMHQIDVSTAFLNGDLEEEVYVQLPSAICTSKQVWKLKKALYGLKQAARVWNERLSKELTALGFTQSTTDPCLFFKGAAEDMMYFLVHVDDAVMVGPTAAVIDAKAAVGGVFDITDMGEAEYFLSIQILRSRKGILLSQEQYCRRVLEQFSMQNCAGKDTPMAPGTVLVKEGEPLPVDNQYCSIVGSLLYLSVNTRPDISYAVGVLSRFMNAPTEQHLKAAKHVLRYLSKYPGMGLFYGFQAGGNPRAFLDNTQITAVTAKHFRVYVDADFAGDTDTRKSTSGMFIAWGVHPIAWGSKLQSIVATSTTEAEFIAAATGAKEGLWLRKLLNEILSVQPIPFSLLVDNLAALSLIRNKTAGISGRTKHIDVQYMFVRERHVKGDLVAEYMESHMQFADMFTKPLTGQVFSGFRAAISMLSFSETGM
jgi:hypothetical protein